MENEVLRQILSKLTSMESDIGGIKQDVDGLKQSIVRIENEQGQKLDAVFDGYKLLYDISSTIRSDIAALKATQEKHDIHIKWLDASKRKMS